MRDTLVWSNHSANFNDDTLSAESPLILHAEKDAHAQADVARLLRERGGYAVIAVSDGEAALTNARSPARQPDLILIGALPLASESVQLLRVLREDMHTRDVPVILIVEQADDSADELNDDAGDHADDYLIKPFTPRQLLTRVGTHLELVRLRREASQRLAFITRATNDALYDLDMRTGRVWSNDAYVRQFGGHPSEVGADLQDWSSRLHPDERDELMHSLNDALRGDADSWTAEYRYRRTDGAYAYVLDRMHIARDAQGRAVRMTGSMLDLTERRATEEALRASEEKFAKAFGLSPVMLSITSLADGRLLDVNHSLLDTTGYVREEVLGRTPVELGWWVNAEQRERSLAELREHGRVLNQEIAFRMRDGRVRICLCSVEIITIDSAPCVLTALVDITQRKQDENTLAEQARLLDLSTDAILVRDASERVTYWSRGAEALYGYSRDEALGRVAFDLLKVQFPRPLDEIKAALWSNGRWEGELIQTCKDGTRLTVLTRWVLDRSDTPDGQPASVLVINTDITVRKRAEEELRRTIGLLRAVSETTTDLIYVKDRAGRMLLANPATLRAIGQPAEAVLGKNEAEWHHDPAQAAQLMKTDQQIMVAGQAQVIEESFTGPDGTRVYLSTKSPWRDERGEVIGLIGVSHDLTSRKRNEETIRQSEARLQQLADAMPQVVWMADLDGVVNYYNRRVLDFAGAEQTQTAHGTWNWQPFLHPDDLEPTLRAWQAATREERPYAMEHRIQMADGSYRWHLSRAYPSRDASGQVVTWFGTATDIHDLKLAEERLAAANTRFRIAENASNGFIYDLDLAASTETRSDNFTRVLGYEQDEIPGGREAWEALIHPDDVTRIRAETDATLNPDSPGTRYEYRLRHKDGRWLWVLDENAVTRDADGKPLRIIGTIVDITARKTYEDRLQRLQAVTASLADAQTLAEVRQVILHQVVSALGSGAGGLRRVAGDALVLDTYELAPHFNEDDLLRVSMVPLAAPHPAAEAARTGQAVFASDAKEIIQRYPELADVVARQGIQAIAHLPLKRGDETFGVLSLPFTEPRAWDENERAFALALADRAAVAYERARLFQVVIASEERFRDLADAMPQIVWSVDATTARVDYLNRQWLEYTGLSLQDSLRDPNAPVHADDRAAAEAVWADNVASARPFEYELRLRRHDGAYRWHLTRCVPARDDEGRITAWYGTSTDIHERKQAERDAQFLADLGALFNNAGDPSALIKAATRAVGEYFGVSRCVLNEVDLAAGVARIAHDYHAGLLSLAGEYPLSEAVAEDLDNYRAGHVVARGDVRTHPRTAAFYEAAYTPAGIRAFLAAPLLQAGRWTGTLWISDSEPRAWTVGEIALLRTVAERVWLAVENTRLQAETQSLNATLEARVAQRTEELRQSREQLRRISARAEQIQENERIRIAREVHDDLGGALTVLKMSLVRVRKTHGADAALTAAIQDLIGQADAMVQTVRRIASDLRPPMLDDLGLLAALEWQASEFERRTGIACRFDMPAASENWWPDGRTSTAVFRVFQESLTNVARHARATEVVATAQQDGDYFVLRVQDNGQGINPDSLRNGKSFGLLGMRERMREVSGDFEITGAAGQGTTVTIRVPLAQAGDARAPS